jgi:hypothetical protein
VIAIGDTSIANIGRWPWSRDVGHAALAKKAEERFQTGEEFGGALRAAVDIEL